MSQSLQCRFRCRPASTITSALAPGQFLHKSPPLPSIHSPLPAVSPPTLPGHGQTLDTKEHILELAARVGVCERCPDYLIARLLCLSSSWLPLQNLRPLSSFQKRGCPCTAEAIQRIDAKLARRHSASWSAVLEHPQVEDAPLGNSAGGAQNC